MSTKSSHLNDDNTFKNGFVSAECEVRSAECCRQDSAIRNPQSELQTATIANAFDPDQTRSSDGTFSAEAEDATSAAHKATAEAHSIGPIGSTWGKS